MNVPYLKSDMLLDFVIIDSSAIIFRVLIVIMLLFVMLLLHVLLHTNRPT